MSGRVDVTIRGRFACIPPYPAYSYSGLNRRGVERIVKEQGVPRGYREATAGGTGRTVQGYSRTGATGCRPPRIRPVTTISPYMPARHIPDRRPVRVAVRAVSISRHRRKADRFLEGPTRCVMLLGMHALCKCRSSEIHAPSLAISRKYGPPFSLCPARAELIAAK